MKKAVLATKYKFNIRKSVAKSVTYRFSLGIVKGIVKKRSGKFRCQKSG